MKKPNITEGEWAYVYDNYSGLYSDGKCFATLDIDNEEDLKAISAVPEMIDALIAIVGSPSPSNEREEIIWRHEVINQSKQALKKAGVEL